MNLKKLRIRSGVSQADLCQAVGITQATLSMIECKRHKPSISTLNKLARFFNITVAELLDYE